MTLTGLLSKSVLLSGKTVPLTSFIRKYRNLRSRRERLKQAFEAAKRHNKDLDEINQVRQDYGNGEVEQSMVGPVKRFNRVLSKHLDRAKKYFPNREEMTSTAEALKDKKLLDEEAHRLVSDPEYRSQNNHHEQSELALLALVAADLAQQALDVPGQSYASQEDMAAVLSELDSDYDFHKEALADAVAQIRIEPLVEAAQTEWSDGGVPKDGTPLARLLARDNGEGPAMEGEELNRYLAGLYMAYGEAIAAEAEHKLTLAGALINKALAMYYNRLEPELGREEALRVSLPYWHIAGVDQFDR